MSKRVFVVCPLRPEYDDLYIVIKQAAESLGASVARPDEFTAATTLISQIYDALESVDVVVCDISDSNGNVMYELGYVHALRRPVIQICRKDSPIPFDVAMTRTLIYDPKSLLKSFRDQLKHALKHALDNPESFSFSGAPRQPPRNRNLFISYSRKDKECLDRLLVHLKPLEKEGVIDLWVDTKLSAGDKWKARIEESLRNARVAVLLVSADFLASDFIVDNELPPLLTAAEAEGTRIIPIILKPCRFSRDKNLSPFQAINDPRQPLLKMNPAEQEEVYDRVSELVESYMRTE